MYCSRCGAELVPNSASCGACGTPIGTGVGEPGVLSRPTIITVLAVLQFIGAAFCLPIGFVGLAVAQQGAIAGLGSIAFGIVAAIGALQLACGIGLWKLKRYGRTLQLVFAWIGLLGIPIGTVISGLILYYLSRPGIKTLFSGRAATELTPEQLAQVAAVSKGSAATIAVVAVLIVLLVVVGVGVIAAIAVPALFRARMSANEAAAIATVRAVLSAEAAYALENGGFYDRVECLATPARCLPMYSGRPLLDPSYTSSLVKSGYRFDFEAGSAADAGAVRQQGLSPTSVAAFSYVAVPTTPGETGTRSFCGDSSGRVCWVPGDVPEIAGGLCAAECRPLP